MTRSLRTMVLKAIGPRRLRIARVTSADEALTTLVNETGFSPNEIGDELLRLLDAGQLVVDLEGTTLVLRRP